MSKNVVQDAIRFLQMTGEFQNRNDETLWSGWIEVKGEPNTDLEITDVSFEETGLLISCEDDIDDYSLAAIPKDMSHCRILFNGTEQPDAAVVFALKSSLGNWNRFAFDFRPITINGKKVRFNLRYDP